MGSPESRSSQIDFIFFLMAYELVDEKEATSQESLVFIKVFEKTAHERLGNLMEKCWMIPLDKFAG